MGLDNIHCFTIVVDMVSGEVDISYPMDTELTEFEMIKNLREIVTECYMDLRDDLRFSEG